jgi:hypothetical protein
MNGRVFDPARSRKNAVELCFEEIICDGQRLFAFPDSVYGATGR